MIQGVKRDDDTVHKGGQLAPDERQWQFMRLTHGYPGADGDEDIPQEHDQKEVQGQFADYEQADRQGYRDDLVAHRVDDLAETAHLAGAPRDEAVQEIRPVGYADQEKGPQIPPARLLKKCADDDGDHGQPGQRDDIGHRPEAVDDRFILDGFVIVHYFTFLIVFSRTRILTKPEPLTGSDISVSASTTLGNWKYLP